MHGNFRRTVGLLHEEPVPMNNSVNVLIVEDNDEHVRLLRQMLLQSEATHFHPIRFDMLGPALERARIPGIDAILLDLTLPDSDGINTFSRMQQAAPETPIVVLSGVSDEALAVETVHSGAQDYLLKGRVDHQTVIRALRYAIERKRAEQELQKARNELEHRVKERTTELVRTNEMLQAQIAEK